MGYPTITNFDVNFIKRTKENLKCDVTNKYTHLMNSLIGLIILPRQYFEQGKSSRAFYNLKISEVRELQFLEGSVTYNDEYGTNLKIRKLHHKHISFTDISVGDLLARFRNAVAHQSLRPTSEGDEWKGVIFRNYSTEARSAKWQDNYDLQIYLTMKELMVLCNYISDCYLSEV